MAKRILINKKKIAYVIGIGIALTLGILIGVAIKTEPINKNIPQDDNSSKKESTHLVGRLNGNKQIVSEISEKPGMNSLYLEEKKTPGNLDSQIVRHHLLDLGMCSEPEILADFQAQKFILNDHGCGDGQSYYIISLATPYTVKALILPYYYGKYNSRPLGWLDGNTIIFLKNSENQSEVYTINLNNPKIYHKLNVSN